MKAIVKSALSATTLVSLIVFFYASKQSQELFLKFQVIHQVNFEAQKLSRILYFPRHQDKSKLENYQALSPKPRANYAGGIYSKSLTVSLSVDSPDSVIYYTLDGSIPTSKSLLYKQPISINKTTVLRFRNFSLRRFPSEIITHSYFINEATNLPIVSLVTEPTGLWNKYLGIYENDRKRGKAWRRRGHVEYFHPQELVNLNINGEIMIHGNYGSLLTDKKPFRLHYYLADVTGLGGDRILTSGSPEIEKNVVLRNGGTAHITRLPNDLVETLYSEVSELYSVFKPANVFLNGEYWGIYNLRERINLEFLETRFGKNQYDLIKLELCPTKYRRQGKRACYNALSGSLAHWYRTQDFFRNNDFADDEVLKQAEKYLDIEQFTDYFLFNIYAGNDDWPHYNSYLFRNLNEEEDNRWRWISWDSDRSFENPEKNDLSRVLIPDKPPYSNSRNRHTLLLRRLLENENYKRKFINRMCDLLNTKFVPERVELKMNALIESVRSELPRDWKRWSISEAEYWQNVEVIRNFIYQRPELLREHFRQEFQLGKSWDIEVNSNISSGGIIEVNSVKISQFPWRGKYFEGMPIVLKAEPAEGFEFVGWTDKSLGKNPEIVVNLNGNLKIGAIFQKL